MTVLPPAPAPEQPARAGFSLPRDIIIAPHRAFLNIARTNEWFPAVAVIVALGLATTALMTPALVHIATLLDATTKHGGPNSAPAPMPQTASEFMLLLGYNVVLVPLLIAGFTAVMLTTVARFKDPAAPLVRFFALVANCLVPSALGNFVHAVAVALRSPVSIYGVQVALPDSLAVFAAPGNANEVDFLARFGLFDAWSFILIAFGFSTFAGVRFTTALIMSFVLDVTYALFFD